MSGRTMSRPSSIYCSPFKGNSRSLTNHQQAGSLLGPHQTPAPAMMMRPASRTSLGGDEGPDAELWYACAGPHKSLPPLYSEVAYLPQGHIEQVASFNNQDVDGQIPRYNLPAVIPCALNNIQLSADPETDEVFATLTLCPLSENLDGVDDNVDRPVQPKKKSNSFAKTLTVSDTSTHGGFSVPRRAAEECLPPLDKSQDPPTQDLVAKDLHGNEWKFRHIFRGQPKRHLLTSGWSHFVSQKRLVASDTVLFLRGEDEQLRIGVRRAPKQHQKSKMLTSPTMTIGVLAAAAHAASEKSRFSLIYNPRSCPSEFVIPYERYRNAMKTSFCVGQRFKMGIESEDPSERRYTGTITRISDYDPGSWPNSPWRSLQVNWDELPSCERQEKVSPWEIGPLTGCSSLPPQIGTKKRVRHPAQHAFHNRGIGNGVLENTHHSLRITRPAHGGHDDRVIPSSVEEEDDDDGAVSSKISWGIKCEDDYRSEDATGSKGSSSDWLKLRPNPSAANGLFNEPRRPEVQDFGMMRNFDRSEHDQNIFEVQQSGRDDNDSGMDFGPSLQLSTFRPALHSFVESRPADTADLQLSFATPRMEDDGRDKTPSLVWPAVSSSEQPALRPSLMEQSANSWLSPRKSHHEGMGSTTLSRPDCTILSMTSLPPAESGTSSHPSTPRSNPWRNEPDPKSDHASPALGDPKCRIFGVPLDRPAAAVDSTQAAAAKVTSVMDGLQNKAIMSAEEFGVPPSSTTVLPASNLGGSELERQRSKGTQNWPQAPVRSFTKVYKLGAIGRSIDITRYEGYKELLQDVEEMFGLEGELFDKRSGWQLVYTDHEEDVLLVGDDPWVEFTSCVRSMRVLSPGEASSIGKLSSTHFSDKDKASQSEGPSRKDRLNPNFMDNSSPSSSLL